MQAVLFLALSIYIYIYGKLYVKCIKKKLFLNENNKVEFMEQVYRKNKLKAKKHKK